MFKSRTKKQLDITTAFLLYRIAELKVDVQQLRKELEELKGTEYERGE